MVGHLAVLDEAGDPAYNGTPTHPATPGLYFNGFRVRLSCQLGLMRIEARRIARDAARLLRGRGRSSAAHIRSAGDHVELDVEPRAGL